MDNQPIDQQPIEQNTELQTPQIPVVPPEPIQPSPSNQPIGPELPNTPKKSKKKWVIIVTILAILLIIASLLIFFIFGRNNAATLNTTSDKNITKPTNSVAKNSDIHEFKLYSASCETDYLTPSLSVALEKNSENTNQYLAYFLLLEPISSKVNSETYIVEVVEKDVNGDYVGKYNKEINLKISFNDKTLSILNYSSGLKEKVKACLDEKKSVLDYEKTLSVDASRPYSVFSDGYIRYVDRRLSYKEDLKNGDYYTTQLSATGKKIKLTVSDKTNIGFVATLDDGDGKQCVDYATYFMDIPSAAGNFTLENVKFELDGVDALAGYPNWGYNVNCSPNITSKWTGLTFDIE